MKKVLTIHGRGSDINKESWKIRRELFKKEGLDLDLFQFDRSVDPTFESWEKTFNKIDFSKYKIIYTNSLGGIILVTYLNNKNIKINRLVMSVPGISFSTLKGLKPNVEKIWENFYKNNINLLVKEIIVINSKDDEVVSFETGKKFAKKLNAKFIELENGGHKLKEYYDFIVNIVKNGVNNETK